MVLRFVAALAWLCFFGEYKRCGGVGFSVVFLFPCYLDVFSMFISDCVFVFVFVYFWGQVSTSHMDSGELVSSLG